MSLSILINIVDIVDRKRVNDSKTDSRLWTNVEQRLGVLASICLSNVKFCNGVQPQVNQY